MGVRISDERRKEIVDWYLEKDERTYMDAAFEFQVSTVFVNKIVKEAGVTKSPYRNKTRNRPQSTTEKTSGVPTAVTRKDLSGHRRRSWL